MLVPFLPPQLSQTQIEPEKEKLVILARRRKESSREGIGHGEGLWKPEPLRTGKAMLSPDWKALEQRAPESCFCKGQLEPVGVGHTQGLSWSQ